MGIEELNKAKIPVVKIDQKLNKLKGKILFPEKLKLANQLLSHAQLPIEKK
jgi:pheromone shutdown protein TraB